ncbi:enoyl-CoA hydratase/isomerase family protein [Roseomonas sp. E05]|uniref:enoyl-CoA hydratase/isomerase family protein n=1 Tax=Roseomonas sp. E05 TaxID=3046310 RepID=UPI0024B9DC7E|nr:enoyl-CoA hydratase/isomerase family protein [Roseomonas sp. E05]MDJ0391295.1 enoyl-CoA hydratase/isomerase family protein [Roseomonas sp. E05]
MASRPDRSIMPALPDHPQAEAVSMVVERDPTTGGLEGAPPSLEVAGAVATIRLNRPRHHNRLEPEDLLRLVRLLDAVEADEALRVLVFTGTGRSFSAGYNIGRLGEGAGPEIPEFGTVADRLERCRVPTICALNGSVYGGSVDLAMAADFRIGAAGLSLTMPAARLGLHYYPSGLQRAVARLGPAAAKRLFLLAEPVGTEELLRIGFLDEAVPAETLKAHVAARATLLAERAPLAVQGMKAALNDFARGAANIAAIEARHQQSQRSADLAEGRAAWLEKRAPRFTGC